MDHNKLIIVSMTSYGKRIRTLPIVLESLYGQTLMPDKILLYIDEKYKSRGDDEYLKQVVDPIVEIRWINRDLGPHTKYYYSFKQFSKEQLTEKHDDICIVTVDDDEVYPDTLIEELVKCHERFPNAVIAKRTHLILGEENGKLIPYWNWEYECNRFVNEERMDLIATGVGGVLYPIDSVSKLSGYDESLFLKLCPYADDIWLKFCEVFEGIPVVKSEDKYIPGGIDEVCSEGLCTTVNYANGNDEQIQKVLRYFNTRLNGESGIDDYIFEKGITTRDDSRKALDRIKISCLLDEMTGCEHLLIYGAGMMGSKLWDILNDLGKEKIIESYIVSDPTSCNTDLNGVEVSGYKDMPLDGKLIVISLFDDNEAKKVVKELTEYGIKSEMIRTLDEQEKMIIYKY